MDSGSNGICPSSLVDPVHGTILHKILSKKELFDHGIISELASMIPMTCKDSQGRTPLHLASQNYSNLSIILSFCIEKEDLTIFNMIDDQGHRPIEYCKDYKSKRAIEKAISHITTKLFNEFMTLLKSPSTTNSNSNSTITTTTFNNFNSNLVNNHDISSFTTNSNSHSNSNPTNISNYSKYQSIVNQRNRHGVTLLHLAVKSGNLIMVKILLELGADPYIKDSKGRLPAELCIQNQPLSPEIRSLLLNVPPTSISIPDASMMEGYLYKWTNYAGGYKKRYFILRRRDIQHDHEQELEAEHEHEHENNKEHDQIKEHEQNDQLKELNNQDQETITEGNKQTISNENENPTINTMINTITHNQIKKIEKEIRDNSMCLYYFKEKGDLNPKGIISNIFKINIIDKIKFDLELINGQRICLKGDNPTQVKSWIITLGSMIETSIDEMNSMNNQSCLALLNSSSIESNFNENNDNSFMEETVSNKEKKRENSNDKRNQRERENEKSRDSTVEHLLEIGLERLNNLSMDSKNQNQNNDIQIIKDCLFALAQERNDKRELMEIEIEKEIERKEKIEKKRELINEKEEEEEEEEFYDVKEFIPSNSSILISSPLKSQSQSPSLSSLSTEVSMMTADEPLSIKSFHSTSSRTSIPMNKSTMPSVSLWSILKNAIGKDLTRIPIPINYSEPISFLQRLCEEMEYWELISKAIQTRDSIEQIIYISTFAISAYAGTDERLSKPFNPLLGETFEYIHGIDDLENNENEIKRELRNKENKRESRNGKESIENKEKSELKMEWKWLGEQVSHHPPISAYKCNSNGDSFVLEGQIRVKTRFWGKSMELIPEGYTRLAIKGNVKGELQGEEGLLRRYSWNKITTIVNNIIVGKLWIDHYGVMKIMGDGELECHVEFKKTGWTGESKKVEGKVINRKNGEIVAILEGYWNKLIKWKRVTPVREGNLTEGSLQDWVTIWEKRSLPLDAHLFYHFTSFAHNLNHMTKSMESLICPTDSRFRSDQRAMEEGHWIKAQDEKIRLEEKQRNRKLPIKPMWFKPVNLIKQETASLLSLSSLSEDGEKDDKSDDNDTESITVNTCNSHDGNAGGSDGNDNNRENYHLNRKEDHDCEWVASKNNYWEHREKGKWPLNLPDLF